MDSIIKVALGVVLGGLILFGIRAAYISYVAYELQKSVVAASNRLAEDNAERLAKAQTVERNKQRRKEEKARKTKLEAKKEREKEAAWDKFFKVSEECLVFKTTQEMVDCSNIRIRARREFEAQYGNSN
ncbi:MAG: hypothetical protein KTR32_27935 [Granulosicoccus sp.]|nr:hypothetical protein [Granulosicoccus sp.]